MSRLIVRFHDSTLDDLSWAIDQIDGSSVAVKWLHGSEPQLAELAKNHSEVMLVIPQQDVYLTSYEVPDKASRRVLSSIEYQIEDQLAQDVERQHFAIGDQSSNPVTIAVLDKSIMQSCIDLIRKHGLVVTQIVPEIFLCPWAGIAGDVNLIESHEGVILRYGDNQCIKCRPQLCETMLDLIADEQDIGTVNYYLQQPDSYQSMKVEKYPCAFNQLTSEHLHDASSECMNLLQRQFQKTSAWSKLLHAWKWVLGLLVVLMAVTSYNKAIALQQLEGQLSHIKTSQYELLKNYLPAGISQTDDLKNELIKLLKQSQSGGEEVNFLELLRRFTKEKASYSSVIIGKIGYQNKRLSIDITSNQLNQLESLLEVIETTGQAAKLENLNIKPDIISGQFILDGAAR
jgi:general secretion pathway protein L